MRDRPSARLLVVDATARVLLFAFAVDGERFWATPGGAVEAGETFAVAAARELFEETGIVADPGPEIARRAAVYAVAGEAVRADERYFLVRVDRPVVDTAGLDAGERAAITAHRWWSAADLAATGETVWPADLAAMLKQTGAWPTTAEPL